MTPTLLREFRTLHEVSQERFARFAGVSTATIYRYERGKWTQPRHALTREAIVRGMDAVLKWKAESKKTMEALDDSADQ